MISFSIRRWFYEIDISQVLAKPGRLSGMTKLGQRYSVARKLSVSKTTYSDKVIPSQNSWLSDKTIPSLNRFMVISFRF